MEFTFIDDEKYISKNLKIYIDDGYLAPINEKGAGIQSAVIINLFAYYIKENSISNSLLCIEEPEIYLHPHACRVINQRLNELIANENSQVIITTHSHIFVKDYKIDNPKIFRVYKTRENGTEANFMEINDNFKNLLIRDENAEIFFSNKVILTEGFDKYIVKFYDDLKSNEKLDDKNISVISAEGKKDFGNFLELCNKLNIEAFILADFDFFLRGDLLTQLFLNFIKIKLTENEFRNLKKNLNIIYNLNIRDNLKRKYGIDENVLEELKYFKDNAKKLEDLQNINISEELKLTFKNLIEQTIKILEKANIFILTGEIEDMFREDVRSDILKSTNNGRKFTFESVIELRRYLFIDNEEPENIFKEEFLKVLEELLNKALN